MTTTVETVDHRPTIIKWGIALVILNILDVFSTHAIFAIGGIELNPVAKLFIYSFWIALLIKAGWSALVVYRSTLTPTRFIKNVVVGVTIFYALILVNNSYHLIQHYWL